MLEHLEKLGYLKAQSGVATPKILRNWHADLKQHPAKNHDETTPTASEFATVRSVLRDAQVITALHSSIEQWLPKPTYDAEIFRVQVPSIVANFQDQLPHCGEGIDSAIHMASVFNAAWEARFAIESEQTTVADITSEQEMLCGLALKSIEGNYIQNLWNQ
jgi:hypothetical protein